MKAILKYRKVLTLVILVILQDTMFGQSQREMELLSKRYTIYHTAFKNHIDLFRASYNDIRANLNDKAPELLDSIEYSFASNSSANRAFSPTTGITMERVGKFIKVVDIQEQSQSYSAGIRNGHFIVSINGVYPMHIRHAWGLLNEKKTIKLEILNGSVKRTVSFKTGWYVMKSVKLDINNRIATFKFHSLSNAMLNKYNELSSALRNDRIDTLVFDLRSIIGMGDIKAVLSVADQYINENVDILEIATATGMYTYTASGNAIVTDIPIKVMIDSTTWGHGLLLAGIFSTYTNAELIGSPTSTDGKLYTIYKIQDSPAYFLRIPVQDYTIGEQVILHGRGLAPKKQDGEKQVLTANQ